MQTLDPAKDVDGFHPLNVGRLLMRGAAPAFVPCTALGCMQLLLRSGIDVRGKNAVILVRTLSSLLLPFRFLFSVIYSVHVRSSIISVLPIKTTRCEPSSLFHAVKIFFALWTSAGHTL